MSPDSALAWPTDSEEATNTTQRSAARAPSPQAVAAKDLDAQTLEALEHAQPSKQEAAPSDTTSSKNPAVLRALRQRPTARGAEVRVRQQWVGRVESVSDDSFLAHLRGASAADEPTDELAELRLEEVSEDQLDLVAPGRVFYWTIGYRTEPHGQRSSFSSLHFRRHLPLREAERAAASDAAAEMSAWLRTDSG